ncbi:hypothetical protein PR202_ga16413 [Eleusine coracana subsp. coracana]|uniref:KIB1-4 beta-propeller domain-containing protein n=1 Tax=Eleusine coracana subsp. coracana TaxID=191504 RepID=A0AAV5CLG1_ELECO|nr:hypothetical protein PR202_ga16413 [Eleusine coracana subsp. coracana]
MLPGDFGQNRAVFSLRAGLPNTPVGFPGLLSPWAGFPAIGPGSPRGSLFPKEPFLPGKATIQHCHPGDTLWHMAYANPPHVFEDMLFVDGTLYVLVNDLRLAIVPLSYTSLELSFLGEESRPAGERFMLEGGRKEVLLISQDNCETIVCRVFCWVYGERKWGMITIFSRQTLFLGLHGFATCIGPADSPGIRGDCCSSVISQHVSVQIAQGFEATVPLADETWDVRYAEYPCALPLNNIHLLDLLSGSSQAYVDGRR